jgi:UDP-2-acetamido-3-amino-2,3-dideoxy-glucuronate N-acetyltransferase
LPQFDLRAVCDPIRAQLGVPWFPSVEALCRKTDARALLIATPPETHAVVARSALGFGLDVFVEKPLCVTSVEARQLADAVKASGRRLMVGHLLAFHPAFRHLEALFAAGQLTRPCSVEVRRWSHPSVDPERCPWWTLGAHDVALLLRLLGVPARLRVSHLSSRPELLAELEFEDTSRAVLSLSTASSVKARRFSVCARGLTAVFDDLAPHKLVARQTGGARPIKVPAQPVLDIELLHFAEALRTGEPFETDLVDGQQVVELLEAGQRSLDSGGGWVRPALTEGESAEAPVQRVC